MEGPQMELSQEHLDTELEQEMNEPVTRRELVEVLSAFAQRDIYPLVEGKFAFLVEVLRFMLVASGITTQDKFNESFQVFMDEFTKRFEDAETSTKEENSNT